MGNLGPPGESDGLNIGPRFGDRQREKAEPKAARRRLEVSPRVQLPHRLRHRLRRPLLTLHAPPLLRLGNTKVV